MKVDEFSREQKSFSIVGIGQNLFSIFVMACLYWIILIIVEFGVIRLIIRLISIKIFKLKPANFVANSNDDNVYQEVQRVNDMVQSSKITVTNFRVLPFLM
jgi:hypothetical protein